MVIVLRDNFFGLLCHQNVDKKNLLEHNYRKISSITFRKSLCIVIISIDKLRDILLYISGQTV